MSEHFADRLLEAIAHKGSPVCVGIDPDFDRLPQELCSGIDPGDPRARLQAITTFCHAVIDVVAPIVPAVKPQVAYFEVFGAAGMELYFDVVRRARDAGLLVIGDVKRGDIGSTAAAYAKAHLTGPSAADAVTVNTYLGADGIEPFATVARQTGRGLFALVRTSNPGGAVIQDFANANGDKLYQHVARQVAQLGAVEGRLGDCGLSLAGAVVGATYPDEARQLRNLMPQQIFLVPGYGAQGASAADCAASFKPDGTGAIVNASRSVLYPHSREEYAARPWKDAVAAAAEAFAADIASALPNRP
ncbi:MAG: orotidine-5'-phosphate decarboxylase [Phycisphaerae bacterium]